MSLNVSRREFLAAAAAASTATPGSATGSESECNGFPFPVDHARLDAGEQCPAWRCDYVAPLPQPPAVEIRRVGASVKENTIEFDPDVLAELPDDAPDLDAVQHLTVDHRGLQEARDR